MLTTEEFAELKQYQDEFGFMTKGEAFKSAMAAETDVERAPNNEAVVKCKQRQEKFERYSELIEKLENDQKKKGFRVNSN